MTRSEEQLDVQKRSTEAPGAAAQVGRHRGLHFTVPVQRETVRIVTEPITDENRGAAMSGPDLSEDEHEVVLHEEVVDVDKQVVPKERVRLEKDAETDEVAVDEEVRKQHIEMDQDDDTRRAR